MHRLSLCIDIDGTITDPYYWLPRANRYFGTSMHNEAAIRNGVQEVISELYDTHYIHFVTAREEKMKFVSLDWLGRHRVPFDSISLLGCPDKVERAKDLECDVFIEDCYDNAMQLAESGFEVLRIDCSYNRGPLLPNITRVYDWGQIKKIVQSSSEPAEAYRLRSS